MLVIRPVRETDLESLHDLAGLTGFGLTTLPRDRDLLAARIDESEREFPPDGAQPARRVLLVRHGGRLARSPGGRHVRGDVEGGRV